MGSVFGVPVGIFRALLFAFFFSLPVNEANNAWKVQKMEIEQVKRGVRSLAPFLLRVLSKVSLTLSRS